MAEKLVSLLVYIYICLGVGLCSIEGSRVEVSPSDKVASVGDNVQFYCKISGDPKLEAVSWKRKVLGGNGTVEDIFHTWPPDGKKINEAKYSFTESKHNPLETSITVKNVAFTDAGRYSCGPTSHADGEVYGSLVVVGPPMVRRPTRLTEGEEAEMVCEVSYLGPPEMHKAGLEPKIVTRLGNGVLHGNTIRTPSSPGRLYHLRSVHKEKMNTSLHQQRFSCDVQVHSPPIDYERTASRRLMVDFPVRNVKLSPVKKVYSPGDSVSCTAEGYPQPTIRWEMVPTKGTSGDSSVLNISHRWVCVATNVVSRMTRYSKSPVVTYGDPTSKQEKDHTLISVIVGVLLGLAVAVSSGVTYYQVASRRSRGHQQLHIHEQDNIIEMEPLKKKESEDLHAETDHNQPILQGVEACEDIAVDDVAKRQPEAPFPKPSTSMLTTMASTEPTQAMDDIVVADRPLCDRHHGQTCTNPFEDQS